MSTAIVWFRQDLRCHDHEALSRACHMHDTVIPLYINETTPNPPMGSAQKWWLHHALESLAEELDRYQLPLCLKSGTPLEILQELIKTHHVTHVYWSRCYEPGAIARDTTIKKSLTEAGMSVTSCRGNLLIEPWNIKNGSGGFFKVFTPYWKRCLQDITTRPMHAITPLKQRITIDSERLSDWNLRPTSPNWAEGFTSYWQPGEQGALARFHEFITHDIHQYDTDRNRPDFSNTSRLSPHLHFGEISIHYMWQAIAALKMQTSIHHKAIDTYLSELGWREFSYHLLYHVPDLPEASFKKQFDSFPWQHDPDGLKRWQQGLTGYPIVDAGMRELWHTGYMHNRVRMIVASFLTKDLLIDWREGARWFWDTLLDADLASNSASWQWVSGSGADAAPYFRIFNPVLQGQKFDPEGNYIKRWVPELKSVPIKWIHNPWEASKRDLPITIGSDYPAPMIDQAFARDRALKYYKALTP